MRFALRSVGVLSLLLSPMVPGADSAPVAQGTAGGAGGFVLRPGVVVDADRGIVYAMRPGGGTEALELSSGRSLWYAEAAAKPLRASGDVLVALAERSKAEAEDPASPSYLDVVVLSSRDGQKQRTLRVPLPEGLWSGIDDGPGRSLKVAADVQQGNILLSWLVEETPLTGIAPGTEGARAPQAAASRVRKGAGSVRIGLLSGRVEAAAADAASVERLTRPAVADAPHLANVSGAQYLSADGRHVLVSEAIADDSVLDKYRWTIYSAEGTRVGELRSAFPQAPFFVSGRQIVFESRPVVRRVEDRLVAEPLKLRAVDLGSGTENWSSPLRDTSFRGPFPEAFDPRWQEETTATEQAVTAAEPGVTIEAFGGSWRAVGPAPKRTSATASNPPSTSEVVGAVQAIAPHPTNANVLYIGSVNGGVWKATNATAARPTWVQLTDTQLSLSTGAMDLDPLDTTGNTLVVGIGRFSSYGRRGGARRGLLRTTDGGTSFSTLDGGGVLSGKNISGVAVRGTRITVSVNTADLAGADQVGIFRSTDTGVTFTQISSGNGGGTGLPAGVTNDLVRDPANSNRLFTGVVADPAAGGQSGVYRSTDGGATWTKVSNPTMDALIVSGTTNNLEFAVGRSNNVYALIANAGALAGVFRSGDGGTTWTAMDVPNANPGGQASIHLSEAADPNNVNLLYLAGDTAMFRCNASLARGSQCVAFRGSATANNTAPHVDSREMAFDAAGNLLESDDGGIFRRTSPATNTGDWFSIGNNIQGLEGHSMVYDANANVVIAGFQDNGTGRELALDDVIWVAVSGGDGGDVAVDTTSSPGLSVRYASSQNLGGFRRQVVDANNVVQSQVSPALTVASGANPTFQFTTPIRLNNVEPRRLLIGASNGVYESSDQGETIRQLTPAIPVNSSGGHPLAYGATGNANVLYVGSTDQVWVRTAAAPAALVQSTTYPGTGTARSVIDLANDPTDPNMLFAIDTTTVYLTQNAGASWTDITGNLLSLGPGQLRSVVHIQNASGEAVAVGTNNGVFAALSSSGFSTWSPMGDGFPRALVFDLDYSRPDDKLVASTLGRGTFVLTQPSFGAATIFSSTFDANTDGFTFVDDAFGTNQPNYASGTFVAAGGFQGGGVRAIVGGVDEADIVNMSGGWRRSFTLSSPQLLTLSFDFNLTQTQDYEANETSDMLSQFDAQAPAVQASLVGNGNGGGARTTGNLSRALNLGCVAAGSHTVTLGLRNNQKTTASESTTLLLDNVRVVSAGPCP